MVLESEAGRDIAFDEPNDRLVASELLGIKTLVIFGGEETCDAGAAVILSGTTVAPNMDHTEPQDPFLL